MTHGLIKCTECKKYFSKFSTEDVFDVWGDEEPIRLINNPANWGSAIDPKYYLLGFSKGATQNKALDDVIRGHTKFEEVPFKDMRERLEMLLEALDLQPDDGIEELFQRSQKDWCCSSLIKCSISVKKSKGGYSYGMKEVLAMDRETNGRVKEIAETCFKKHHSIVGNNRIFIMLSLDDKYIKMCREVFAKIFGELSSESKVDYSTKNLTWVHVSHPSGRQTDPQYIAWVNAETKDKKVLLAKRAIDKRKK